jgi:hypothetical protein
MPIIGKRPLNRSQDFCCRAFARLNVPHANRSKNAKVNPPLSEIIAPLLCADIVSAWLAYCDLISSYASRDHI